MRSHPLENDCDERGESWIEIISLVVMALIVGVGCMIWDGAVDGWRLLVRRVRR